MPAKIMVCDDAQLTRRTLKNILENSGYQVIGEAVNGKDAVTKFKELKPDVVFMDIVMPEMDGIEAVRQIVGIDENVVIIMCSSLAQEKKVVTAVKAGARDFIVKPFTQERVLDAIQRYGI